MMDVVEQRIPKNVRQIGEPGGGVRIYIEDYAYTYLHQLAEEYLTGMRTAVLVGRAEESGTIYIQGALEAEMGREIRGWFSHEHWRNIFQDVQEWYEGLEVVGWCLSNPGFPPVLTEELKNLHLRNFPGARCVFLQMDALDGEEIFYGYGQTGLAPLGGYYIYYERNDPMQAYMSQRRGGAGIEPEGVIKDRAAARFRNVMQEKKEQNSQRKMLAFLYGASVLLVMVILVIGITMINHYDRMVNMEDAIHQISENLDGDEPGNGVSLEEAAEEENRRAAESTPAAEPEVQAVMSQAVQEIPEEPEETPDAEAETAEPARYQVQAGDTLLEICRTRYGDEDMVSQVCELNQLDDWDKIYEGQVLLLP